MTPLALPDDSASLAPKDLGRLVAGHLAQVLPGGQWKVTRDGVRESEGEQTTDLTLQRSTGSRTGLGVWFYPRLVVRDERLSRWRQQRGRVRGGDAAVLFNSMLINVSGIKTVELLTGISPRVEPLSPGRIGFEEFEEELVGQVLPNRDHLRSPLTLRLLPDRWLWNPGPLVEWSVAAGHPELCWSLIERSVGPDQGRRRPFLKGVTSGLEGEPSDDTNGLVDLGNLMAQLREHVGSPPAWVADWK